MYLTSGQILQNRYQVKQLLGQGGFGAVYQAHDQILDITVAIKMTTDLSPHASKQFQQEAQMLARLRHPNLPRVSDYFTVAGEGHYLVMDFIAGQNLAQFIAQHDLPTEAQAIKVIKQICNALQYLHEQTPPIVHRDIKPANIIITPQGQAMLVDFGIAKFYHTYKSTSTGARGLTPGYAPPEQYSNSRTDARSDIYALGATLYTLMTAQIPPEAITRLVHNTPLRPPRQINTNISRQFEQIIIKGMALKITDRFQTASELSDSLQKLSQLPSTQKRGSSIGSLFLLFTLFLIVSLECAYGLSIAMSNVPFSSIYSPNQKIPLSRVNYPFATNTPTSAVAANLFKPIEQSTETATLTPPPPPTYPPATFTPNPSPTQTNTPIQLAPPQPTSTPDYPFVLMNQYTASSANDIYFTGFLSDETGQPINGYSILLDNGYFHVLSHPTGPSKWLPDNPNGQWDIRLYNINDAQGTWRVAVVAYQCNFEQGFDAQCQNYRHMSAETIVEIKSYKAARFNLEWQCKRNCDDGLYMPLPNTATPTPRPISTPLPTATTEFIPPISPLPTP